MTKKKKAKPMKKRTKPKPHPDLHHLMMLLKYTQRNIKNDGSDMDELFKRQEDRIWKRLGELG